MIQVRENVFETNSSSAHSLVIYKTKDGSKRLTTEDCIHSMAWDYDEETGYYTPDSDNGYFGRYPFRVLTSFRDKLDYAYANCPYRRRAGDERAYPDYYPVNRVMRQIVPGFKRMKKHRKFYMGCDDYQLFGWLKKANISLKDYLLDPSIVVICDGDEYCVWSGLKRRGLVNKDNIRLELPEKQWWESINYNEEES